MDKTTDPTPPAATGETPPRRRPRYKNPNRSDRQKVRAALRGVPVNFNAAEPEELATLAGLRTAFVKFEGSARAWERRAASGGFTAPTGERLPPAECLARAAADRKSAEDAGRRGRELLAAINARAPFWPSFRNRRERCPARPWISPLHLHGDGGGADSGASGAEEVAQAGGRVVVSRP